MKSKYEKSSYMLFSKEDPGVMRLLMMSDKFYKTSKSIISDTNTLEGTQKYFKLIRLSMKCLRIMLIRYEHKLHPQLKCHIFHRLATLYFQETQDYERAEFYCSKCISLASRNSIQKYRLLGMLSHIEVLSKVKPEYSRRQLANYEAIWEEHPTEVSLLYILRHRLFNDLGNQCVSKAYKNSINKCIEPLKTYICLLSSQCSLITGHLKEFAIFLGLVDPGKFEEKGIPVQMRLMYYLLNLLGFLLKGQMIELKGCAKSIEGIIQKEREAQWKTWTSQGQISITINISQSNESIAFQLYWLNNMEFVSLYRLVTGVGLISQGLAAAALAPLKSGLRAMSSLMNGPEFNAVPFCGSLGQLNNHLVTSGRIIFNFLFYIEWIKSLNQINCDICGIIEDSDGLVSKLNERYLTNCDNFTVAHIYQRKDQYLKTLIKLKSHNLNDSVKCFSQLLTQTSLPVDIKVFSIIQNINALLEVRDSLSHDDDSYGHTMVTIQNLKNMLNDFMNSKEKYEHGSFLQANAEVVDMILVISLVAEPTSTKNHHKIFGVLKNLNQDEICTPFLKILTSLICSFNESSLVTADERLQDCFKASKRLGKSYNDNVLRVAISKGEMYLLEKKGAPAAEIEEIKFRIMEIEKTQSNKTQRNRS